MSFIKSTFTRTSMAVKNACLLAKMKLLAVCSSALRIFGHIVELNFPLIDAFGLEKKDLIDFVYFPKGNPNF